MTQPELHKILKSRPFKSSVEGSTENYIFRFTEIYIIRNNKPIGIYELIQEDDYFKLVISHLIENISTQDFKNVILVIPNDDRFPIIINSNSLAIQAGKGFDITLIGQ